ncbi:MAG: Gfo/Idh/MocA family oxidoreductase [bacterium]|nr:Gfo/Idh/MocA family oxidoreductase [bacterium]
MKQVIQNYKTGELKIEEVAYPILKSDSIIFKTKSSLISAGTERTKIETAQMNLIEKAMSRLDLVKTLVNNIKQEGVLFTFKKAFNKLNTPITLGYSASGIVVDSNTKLKKGDRVAAIGEITAAHADYNVTPSNSFVKMPDNVSFDEAAFGGLGAIALNAVEISQLKKGEKVVLIGLGLLGQIVLQVLMAKGVEVIGVEIDDDKLDLAKKLGLRKLINPLKEDMQSIAKDVDAVLITAASRNNFPIELAGRLVRNKGRVILVGSMPINIPREDFYSKEIIFMIARGFGADLYYNEEEKRNYSFSYKPRTMKENLARFLQMVSAQKINLKLLMTHKFKLNDAKKAYQMICENKEKYLAILFEYDDLEDKTDKIIFEQKKINNASLKNTEGKHPIGFIGAGSFAQGYILPTLKKRDDLVLVGVASATGVNANNVARKFGFSYATRDFTEILNDKNIETVFITTRHNLHAKFVILALEAGKNVFVEKPLCLTKEELAKIKVAYLKSSKILMVGFNRRFSPFIEETKTFFLNRFGPMMLTYRVNAGFLPSEHWLHHKEGGGRVVGEGCHFIDLVNFLVDDEVMDIKVCGRTDENFNITVFYKDSSIASIQYSSVGDVSYSRERLEAFCDNSAVAIDNYKKGDYSRKGRVKKLRKMGRDMGHKNEINYFVDALIVGKALISFDDLVKTTEMTLLVGKHFQ